MFLFFLFYELRPLPGDFGGFENVSDFDSSVLLSSFLKQSFDSSSCMINSSNFLLASSIASSLLLEAAALAASTYAAFALAASASAISFAIF